jgi:hypothetical protein
VNRYELALGCHHPGSESSRVDSSVQLAAPFGE